MIEVQNITKSFDTLKVLKGINLHVNKGEVVCIVGPSGAGKTTLLQVAIDETGIQSLDVGCETLPKLFAPIRLLLRHR